MLQCVKRGHEIVCLVNLLPADEKVNELDSFMYQTVGHTAIDAIAEAMEVPLLRFHIKGKCLESELQYTPHSGDEVEDLYYALKTVKDRFPDVEGVSSGAILSNYQRERVENVCSRLNLISLAFLWEQEQRSLLHSMIEDGLVAVIIKTATMGLDRRHVGKTLNELEPYLLHISDVYGCNPCGEGGEYETFTIDCPLFKRRVVFDSTQVIVHSNDIDAPVILLVPLAWHLEPKAPPSIIPLPTPISAHPPTIPIPHHSPRVLHASFASSLSHLQTLVSTFPPFSRIALVAAHFAAIEELLRLLPSPPVITPIISAGVGDSLLCFPQSFPREKLVSWQSRSCWCPPPAGRYAMIEQAERYFSFPTVLPLDPTSTLLLVDSAEAAMSDCETIVKRMLKKVEGEPKRVVAVIMRNRRWGVEETELLMQDSYPVMIEGWVDDIVEECPLMMEVDGYTMDRYNDECEESVEVSPDAIVVKYGDFITFSIKGYPSTESITLQSSSPSERITVYYEDSQSHTIEGVAETKAALIPLERLRARLGTSEWKSYSVLVQSVVLG
ncbi:hypothetical protein WA538_004841 [Blastocystis sp. DL]